MSTKYESYGQIRSITESPLRGRRQLAIGRGGARVKPRRYHLTADRIKELRTERETNGTIPNPFNAGCYHAIVSSLSSLGVDRKHTFAAVYAEARKQMSVAATKDEDGLTAWQRFTKKEAKGSKETSLDASDRFLQNIKVLQRLGGFNPYGLKLLEVGRKVLGSKGMAIDLLAGSAGEVFVRLNTDSNTPLNELLVRAEVQKPTPRKRVKRTKAVPAATQTAEAAAATA